MKKVLIVIMMIFAPFIFSCGQKPYTPGGEKKQDTSGGSSTEQTSEVGAMKINISVNGYSLLATLEDSEAGTAFY